MKNLSNNSYSSFWPNFIFILVLVFPIKVTFESLMEKVVSDFVANNHKVKIYVQSTLLLVPT